MVTASNFVYSASAVRRILGIDKSIQVRIQAFVKVVWVHVAGNRPTFISKRVFLSHFAEWRKQQGQGLEVRQMRRDRPHQFQVLSGAQNHAYAVECREEGVFCCCDDFNNQLQFFGRGCCKHGYAVLNRLGLGSLAEYLQVWARRDSERAAA